MAEAIVGDLAAGLVRKLVSLAINDVIQVWKLDEDLETLRERFELIGALLHDAHAKNVIMSTAKIWFNKLEQVAHVTEAFMDELEYEVTRRKVEHHHKVIGNDLCGGLSLAPKAVTTTMYPSVTKLILRRLPKLEEWVEDVLSKGGKDQIVFPKLEELEISDCPKLRKILNSCFPSLKVLRITNSESNMILETMHMHVSSLTTLELHNIRDRVGDSSSSSSCSNLESILKLLLKNNSLSLTSLDLLDCKGLQHLTLGVSLEILSVYDCPNLVSINLVEGSAGLKYLSLRRLPSSVLDGISSQVRSSTLRSLSLGPFSDEFPWPFSSSLHSFPNLVWLALRGTEKVKSIALFEQLQLSTFPALSDLIIRDFGVMKALVLSIAKLPSLEDLDIKNCKDLERVSLFDESHCLQHLYIKGCPILKERYKKETGPEWFKIQHIPSIRCDDEMWTSEEHPL